MRISQVANNVAVHSVSNLNSMDNVTLLIIILSGGPASCPVQLPARKKYNPRSFSKNVGTGLPLPLTTCSAPRVEEAKGLGEYSSNRATTEKAVDAPLDTHLDEGNVLTIQMRSAINLFRIRQYYAVEIKSSNLFRFVRRRFFHTARPGQHFLRGLILQ